MSDFGFNLLQTLEGDVYSQGVKISARAWLDIGSKDWTAADDATRAAAYQAAQVTGWSDESIREIIVDCYPHVSAFFDYTLKQLKDFQSKYPVEVEQVYVPENSIHIQKG